MNRGFTVVEVLITLIIIGILLGLGTVGLRATLANGRDSERQADAETIARGLERFYDGEVSGKPKGSYPSYNEFWNEISQQGKRYSEYLPGTAESALTTPAGTNGLVLLCIFESPSGYWATQPGCETPGIETKIKSVLQSDKYGYEAIGGGGEHCYNAGGCVAFNLYWYSEVQSKVIKITSRRS